MDDLLRIASVQAQAETSILNGGRELDFIAVAPIIAGGADVDALYTNAFSPVIPSLKYKSNIVLG